MRFRRDAPAAIVGSIAVLLAVLTFAANALFARQMAAVEADRFALVRAILESGLTAAEDRALARAELVAELPAVRRALAARDRDALLAELAPMYAVQRDRHGVDQAQFATDANVSFLRLNNPERPAEDLSTFRPIIVATNRDRTPRKGFALGRSGPALVAVVPVRAPDDTHAGVFEIGMDFAPLMDRLKATYGLDFAFLVREKPLREIATGVTPEVLDEHNRVGEFLRYTSTNGELLRALVAADDLARVNGDPVQYARDAGGATYGVVLVALRNAAGDSLGVIAAAGDLTATRAAARRALVQQAALALVALVLLAGVVVVVIRGFVLRPVARLDRAFGSLDAEPEPLPQEPWCDELAALAARYEALRAKRGAGDP